MKVKVSFQTPQLGFHVPPPPSCPWGRFPWGSGGTGTRSRLLDKGGGYLSLRFKCMYSHNTYQRSSSMPDLLPYIRHNHESNFCAKKIVPGKMPWNRGLLLCKASPGHRGVYEYGKAALCIRGPGSGVP